MGITVHRIVQYSKEVSFLCVPSLKYIKLTRNGEHVTPVVTPISVRFPIKCCTENKQQR